MIAVDTNILARLLVKDDPAQTRKVVAFFERLDASGDRAYVSKVVMCELVWVLRHAYAFDRGRIVDVLRRVIASRQLVFDSPDDLVRALRAFQSGRGDFADYIIREEARAAGCSSVVTFDRALLKHDMFAPP